MGCGASKDPKVAITDSTSSSKKSNHAGDYSKSKSKSKSSHFDANDPLSSNTLHLILFQHS